LLRRRFSRTNARRSRSFSTWAWAIPQGPNQLWSLDFVSDALASSRKFRLLTAVDDFSRECLACYRCVFLSGVVVLDRGG